MTKTSEKFETAGSRCAAQKGEEKGRETRADFQVADHDAAGEETIEKLGLEQIERFTRDCQVGRNDEGKGNSLSPFSRRENDSEAISSRRPAPPAPMSGPCPLPGVCVAKEENTPRVSNTKRSK